MQRPEDRKPTYRYPLPPRHGKHRVLPDEPLDVMLAARLEHEARVPLCVLLQIRRHQDLSGELPVS
jgi:hypothetical protein